MEEAIRKARKKAENFLSKEVERISQGIKKEDGNILSPFEWSKLPIRFEAHLYLGNRDKNLRQVCAKEIRELWLHWQKSRVHYIQIENKNHWAIFFYPTNLYYIPYNQNTPEYPGFDPHRHITMLRTKEIFEIPGFRDDFNKAVELIRNRIIALDSGERDFWQIFRSRTIQNETIQDLRDTVSILLKRLQAFKQNNILERFQDTQDFIDFIDNQIYWIIYILMSQFGGKFSSDLISLVENIISYQSQNGSVCDDIMTTCSFIIAVNLTHIDPLKIIQDKALKWLMSQQNRDGSWDHWADQFERKSSAWSVLSTVIVLETIDLITEHRPLPNWIPTEMVEEEKSIRPPRVQDVDPLEVPLGTTWKEVTIRIRSLYTARLVFPGEVIDNIDFRRMGFKDHKTKGPDKLWRILVCFAKNNGEISRKTEGIPVKKYEDLITDTKDMGNRLKHLFQIDVRPFQKHRKDDAYKSKFDISLAEDFKLEEEGKSELVRDEEEDIRRKESQRYEDIQWARMKETKTLRKKKK